MSGESHDIDTPSQWIVRWADRIPAGGRVLDVACGNGRHARYFASRSHPVDAVDRDPEVLSRLAGAPGITPRCADIEGGPWPYRGGAFAGIIVVHYLYRPLFPDLLAALAPGGVLIYETFAAGNERFGRPTNPAFLLKPGELLEVVRDRLEVIAYEALEVAEPRPAVLQRICATRPNVS